MSAEMSLSSVFDYLSENLQIVIDQIKDGETSRPEAPDFSLEAFWLRIGVCVKAVSQEATKLCLACSEPPLPSSSDLQPLVNGIERASLALVSAYYSLPISQGQTLRRLVTDSVLALITALQTLVVSLNTADGTKSKRHLQSTGSVWEICDKFPHLPKDNRQAALSQAKETLELISDALEELEESLTNGPDDTADDLDDLVNGCHVGDNDDESISPKSWSDTDRLVVSACLGIIKTAKATTKKLPKAIETNGCCDTIENITQLDNFVDKVSVISPVVDDLVSSLYPPVKLDIVSANSHRLVSELRQLLEIATSSHFTGSADASWLEFLNKAVDHNAVKTSQVIANQQ